MCEHRTTTNNTINLLRQFCAHTNTAFTCTQELIGARQDEIEQRVRLPAAWTGWRMQGSVLVPKHRRFQIHPETAERFGEWAKSGSTGGA
jgi:hypothetical protein